MPLLLSALYCFVIVFLVTPLLKILALKFSILDIPNARKIHTEPTPLLGGLAVYAGVMFVLWLAIFAGANLMQSAFTKWCPAIWFFQKIGMKEC